MHTIQNLGYFFKIYLKIMFLQKIDIFIVNSKCPEYYTAKILKFRSITVLLDVCMLILYWVMVR